MMMSIGRHVVWITAPTPEAVMLALWQLRMLRLDRAA